MKLVVLSDLHLMADPDDDRNLNNHSRFIAALDRINTAYSDAELVVFAGDIADRGKLRAPYERFKEALSTLRSPHAVTLGNHDARDVFVSVVGKRYCDENGFLQSVHDLGDTRVILLDSASDAMPPKGFRGARSPKGQLCPLRLAWLDKQLDTAQGRPIIVILHHPPMQLQITSDTMALQSPEHLIDRLVAYGNVQQVLSGHIHMTTTCFHRGIPFTTIAGGFSTSFEDYGRCENKARREGPAQMAVVLGEADKTIVHFDNYVDAHPRIKRR